MRLSPSGLRPQDVLILCKLLSWKERKWKQIDLAHELFLSQTEITFGLNRLIRAGLVDENKKRARRLASIEFLTHAVKFFFPPTFGRYTRGIPTALSHHALSGIIINDDLQTVWPHADGEISGMSLDPIYKTAPDAAKKDPDLHRLLSIVDTIRVKSGFRVNEAAKIELTKIILKQGRQDESK
ncbi:MAG: hypothetical protein HYW49_06525 [Deltaproteobacteria bacterium]|nr:hypothetical protein [Deltaproteobacteria bacterium]